jgi:hypothetical protein
MEQNPSWEVNILSVSKETTHFFYRTIRLISIQKSLPLNPSLMNPIHNISPYFPNIHFNIGTEIGQSV